MKKEKQKRNNMKILRLCLGVFAILCVLVPASYVYSANPVKAERDPMFSYDSAGKIDPFKPFVEAKRKAEQGKEKKRTAPLTPLEKYDMNDLKLVGIAATGNGEKIAMIEDAEGKFYPIATGTPIGLNGGRVSQIMDTQVIISEEITDFAGKHHKKQSIMKLKEKSEE